MKITLLALDVGNTSTALALFDQRGRIIFRNRMTTPTEFAAPVLRLLLKKHRAAPVPRVVASSVVPWIDHSLRRAVKSAWDCNMTFIRHDLDLGFSLDIDDPRELGADRICGCAGALTICRPPLLIIDSGTATTFDLVDVRQRYIGGCILPGLEISLRALAENTAKLKRIAFKVPASPLGKNTVEHIRAGIYYGYLGTIEYLTAEYKKILGRGATVIATGGMSRLFHDRVTGIDRHEPDLLFFGLQALAARNS